MSFDDAEPSSEEVLLLDDLVRRLHVRATGHDWSEGARPIPQRPDIIITPEGRIDGDRGGQGTVWAAHDGRGERIAVKVLPGQDLASVPMVPPLFGVIQCDYYPIPGGVAVIMPRADGTLGNYDFGADPHPFETLLEFMRSVAAGLDALHRVQNETLILHRDVKPGNILRFGKHAVIADLDLAKAIARDAAPETHTRETGTTPFIAPEGLVGKHEPASDQYSLAVTYSEVRKRFPSPLLFGGERDVLAKALSHAPRDRWVNCSNFVDALCGVVAPKLVSPLSWSDGFRAKAYLNAFTIRLLSKWSPLHSRMSWLVVVVVCALFVRHACTMADLASQRHHARLLEQLSLAYSKAPINPESATFELLSAAWHAKQYSPDQTVPEIGGAALDLLGDARIPCGRTTEPNLDDWETISLERSIKDGRRYYLFDEELNEEPANLVTIRGVGDKSEVVPFHDSRCLPPTCISQRRDLVVARITSQEFGLWSLRTRRRIGSLRSDSSNITTLMFTGDSQTIASGHQNGEVRLWDVHTLRAESSFQTGAGPVTAIIFGQNNGCIVTGGSSNNVMRVWSARAPHKLLWEIKSPQKNCTLTSVAIAPDGSRIATGWSDGLVHFLNRRGEHIGNPVKHPKPIESVAFSPSGARLAVSSFRSSNRTRPRPSAGEGVFVWDVSAPARAQELFRFQSTARDLSFSPDGSSITGISSGCALTWDLQDRRSIDPFRGHRGSVSGVSFNREGTLLASSDSSGAVFIWNARDGRPQRTLQRPGDCLISEVRFYGAGEELITLSRDLAPIIDDDAPNDEQNDVWALERWNSQGRLSATTSVIAPSSLACTDASLAVVQMHEEPVVFDPSLQTCHNLHPEPQRNMKFRVTEHGFLVGVQRGEPLQVGLWTLSGTQRCLTKWTLSTMPPRFVEVSPDGETLAFALSDKTVRLWSNRGEPIGEVLVGHKQEITCATFSPDGQMLATADIAGSIRLWDASTGAPIGRPLDDHEGSVSQLCFDPWSKTLASTSSDGTVRLWNTDWRQALATHAHRLLQAEREFDMESGMRAFLLDLARHAPTRTGAREQR